MQSEFFETGKNRFNINYFKLHDRNNEQLASRFSSHAI